MVGLSDDVVYCLILLVSLPLAHVTKIAKGGQIKRALCTTVGVVIVYVTCGSHIFHSLVTALVNIAILKLTGPRKCHIYSFIWCFGYLLFFRTCHYLGFPQPPALSNAVQLFVTLRMVGVAFELHDNDCLKREDCSTEEMVLKKKYQEIDPSVVDLVHYSYCFLGQFTGPYFKYRTYIDMIENDDSSNIPTIDPVMNRLRPLLIILPCYLVFTHFFSLEYVRTDVFYDQPFWFRLFYMVPMFIIFRCRLYYAWLMSECIAMASSLGGYPVQCKAKYGQGPSDLKALDQCKSMDKNSLQYEFETIRSLDIYGMELAPKVRDGVKSWNMTVQYWFANCVHRRIPKQFKAFRVGITVAVSAFWHGVHPGYYLSFLFVIILVAIEDRVVAIHRSQDEEAVRRFDWIIWFFKMRGFEYMNMGFLLLRLDLTLAYWKSIFFLGHIVGFIFLAIGYMSPLPKRRFISKDR